MDDKDINTKITFLSRSNPPILEGVIGWLVMLQFILPTSLQDPTYVHIIILLAPLVVVPLGIRFSDTWTSMLKPIGWAIFPCALLTVLPYCIPQILWLGYFAIPWFVWCLLAAFFALKHFAGSTKFSDLPRMVGFLYLPVGAAWLLADRLGLHPLGFRDPIVMLTAAHFHYAGFILPVLAAQLLTIESNPLLRFLTWGIMLGIPLVPLGIISTHYGGPWWLEAIFATVMALSGMGLAFWRLGLALRQKFSLRELIPILGSILLFIGMNLALLFAWRSHPAAPIELSIPQMYAVHGTLNALGCLFLVMIPIHHNQPIG